MKRAWMFSLALFLAVAFSGNVLAGNIGKKARKPAIRVASERIVDLQRTDLDWEGTWYWCVGDTFNATNLTGVTALGLLEAYLDDKDPVCLEAAVKAAEFIQTHLGAGATGIQHHVRTTAPDIVFLHHLAQATGDQLYADRAVQEWFNITSFVSFATPGNMDALFRSIKRASIWDIAFFLEAAYLSGDFDWADGAAAILADTEDDFYYGDTGWYALNLAGAIRALVGCGYADLYYDQVIELLYDLIAVAGKGNGVDGYIQDTAYAIMAMKMVGGAATGYANNLAKWLSSQMEENGGWLEVGYEYPEINGEAVRAMAATIGQNVSIGKFKSSGKLNSSWRRAKYGKPAIPFNGE